MKQLIKNRVNKDLKVGSYDYNGLSHWFVYNWGYKSTANGRMSCDGNAAYSYRTKIAQMYDAPKGYNEPFILISGDTWSNTTTTHIGAIYNASRHLNQIEVSKVDPYSIEDHRINLQFFYDSIIKAIKKYKKARKDWSKDSWYRQYHKALKECELYADLFKVKREKLYKAIKKLPAIDDELAFKTIAEIEAKLKKQAKAEENRRRKALIAANKEKAEQAKVDLANWLKGGNTMPNTSYLDQVYIRIKGAFIETTERATISLKSCIEAYRKYEEGTLNVGDNISGFNYRGIDTDGNALIGCHIVPMKQIKQLLQKDK